MFFVLRIVEKKLGWLRTTFVYILSGVGGSVVSAVFVPYYPEVRFYFGVGFCIHACMCVCLIHDSYMCVYLIID